MSLMNVGWEVDSLSAGIITSTTPINSPCAILGYQLSLSMAPLNLNYFASNFCEILFSGFIPGVSPDTGTFGAGASNDPEVPLHGGAGESSMLVCAILKSGLGEGVNLILIRNFVNPIRVLQPSQILWQMNYGGKPAVDFEMQGIVEFNTSVV